MKSKKFKVLVTDVPNDVVVEKTVLGNKFQVYLTNIKKFKKLSKQFKLKIDAILTGATIKFDSKELSNFPNCKIISRYGIGYDKIDLNEAIKKNIKICVVPDYGVDEVSDHALTMILNLNRSLGVYDMNMKNLYRRNIILWDHNYSPFQKRLKDMTLGIIGLGRIGSSLARKAKSLNMNVIFYDPFVKSGYEKILDIKRVYHLNEIAKYSDAVSLHVPYNKRNHNFVDDNFFKNVKKKIIFINVSRGGLVSSKILAKYYGEKISGIGLDVFENEPPEKTDKIINLWKKKENDGRIVITPHSAFYSLSAFTELRTKATKNIREFLINGKLINCLNVNKDL